MVFSTAEALTPCLTQKLSPENIDKWKEPYRYAKKYGVRATFATIIGTGYYTLVKEAATDEVKRDAKDYLGGILIHTGLTCSSGGIPPYYECAKKNFKIFKSLSFSLCCYLAWSSQYF